MENEVETPTLGRPPLPVERKGYMVSLEKEERDMAEKSAGKRGMIFSHYISSLIRADDLRLKKRQAKHQASGGAR